MKTFKTLFLGDVNGASALKYVCERLHRLRGELDADLVIVNGENCAVGNGIDREGADALFSHGADVVTTGNHAFKQFVSKALFEENPCVLRPANFPDAVAGNGYTVFSASGRDVLIINLLGIMYLEPLASPFDTAEKILRANAGKYDLSFIDFHAEATSEKNAFLYAFAGRVTGIFGTHTHVTTADERVYNGTAFITDVGMCGPEESVLGLEPSCVIEKLTLHTPVKFVLSENPIRARGVLTEADAETGRAVSIKRIEF